MIIRLFRYALRAGTGVEFERVVASHPFPRPGERDGLLFGYAARSRLDSDRGVVVTGWQDYAKLAELAGPSLEGPAFFTPAAPLLVDVELSHWEGIDVPPLGVGSGGHVLRILQGHVDTGVDADYFAFVRNELWPTLERVDGLRGAWIGRQLRDHTSQGYLAVSAWSSEAEMVALAGGPDRVILADRTVGLVVDGLELLDVLASAPLGQG